MTEQPIIGDSLPWAPVTSRDTVRLIIAREILPTSLDHESRRLAAHVLGLGRLHEHAETSGDVLPGLVWKQECATEDLTWKRLEEGVPVEKALHAIWVAPGSGTEFAVQIVDLHPTDGIVTIIHALEDMFHGDLDMNAACAAPVDIETKKDAKTHQLVVFSKLADQDDDFWDLNRDQVQRLIYRADLPARPEYTDILRPSELNRRPYSGAALGPFLTVLWGQQDYIENCAFLSVLIGAAASAVIRDARQDLIYEIQQMQHVFSADDETALPSIDKVRQELAQAYRTVAATENRIALCIDGLSTIQPYLPSMRPESYHRTLFEALNAEGNRQALERMLGRLNELVRIQREVLENRLRSIEDARRRQWSITIGLASVVAIPFTVIFAFFSVGTAEIDPETHMLSTDYWIIYALVGATLVATVVQHVWASRRNQRKAEKPLEPLGVGIVE